MSHVVSSKIFKAPFTKDGCGQDGQSKMYSVDLSEVVKDYKTGEKTYANYKALFFAKSDAAKNYYDQALNIDSFVVVSCEKLKVEQREHNGTNYVTLLMENPSLEGANFSQSAQPAQQQQYHAPQQQPAPQMAPAYQPQQPQQQAPRPTPQHKPQYTPAQQQAAPANTFDDEIPF